MKRKLVVLLLAAVLLLSSVCAAAETATLSLPAAVTVVGSEAFAGIPALGRVLLPEGMRGIGAMAFAGSGLTEISLPPSLTFIAEDAFEGSSLERVYAVEDTYAWQWAAEHGYIPADSPLSATVTCSVSGARVGDTVTWKARADGAVGVCRYSFALYAGDELLREKSPGSSDTFSCTLTREGVCRVEAVVTDGYATVTAVSESLTVGPPPLSIAGLEVEKSDFIGAETHAWTTSVTGGKAPYSYRFTLKKGSTAVASRDYSSSAAYAYTFFEAGSYTLTVQVKGHDGEMATKQLNFTAAPKNLAVKAKVRIYVACDEDGGIKRNDGSTGHYDLQLSSGGQQLAFDEHLITDPTILFGRRGSEQGVVRLYDSSVIPFTGYKMYTFEFRTSTGKIATLLYDRLRDARLNTDTEVKKQQAYNYDVKSGPFTTYEVSAANCFTAVAAWCKLLGYGKLSDIVEASASYTDYLAWRMYDLYGGAWRYEGRY